MLVKGATDNINFNSVEVKIWMSNWIPLFYMDVATSPWPIPQSLFAKGDLVHQQILITKLVKLFRDGRIYDEISDKTSNRYHPSTLRIFSSIGKTLNRHNTKNHWVHLKKRGAAWSNVAIECLEISVKWWLNANFRMYIYFLKLILWLKW